MSFKEEYVNETAEIARFTQEQFLSTV